MTHSHVLLNPPVVDTLGVSNTAHHRPFTTGPIPIGDTLFVMRSGRKLTRYFRLHEMMRCSFDIALCELLSSFQRGDALQASDRNLLPARTDLPWYSGTYTLRASDERVQVITDLEARNTIVRFVDCPPADLGEVMQDSTSSAVDASTFGIDLSDCLALHASHFFGEIDRREMDCNRRFMTGATSHPFGSRYRVWGHDDRRGVVTLSTRIAPDGRRYTTYRIEDVGHEPDTSGLWARCVADGGHVIGAGMPRFEIDYGADPMRQLRIGCGKFASVLS